jgi:hypothetical protein
MDPQEMLATFLARLEAMEQLWSALEDRVGVLEENTTSWDCRIEELEEWQKKVDDIIDEY